MLPRQQDDESRSDDYTKAIGFVGADNNPIVCLLDTERNKFLLWVGIGLRLLDSLAKMEIVNFQNRHGDKVRLFN